MSSSPQTTSASRSPSPHTPHSAEQVPFHDAWLDDQHMLQIDDLLEQHAFDDSVPNPLPAQHLATLTKSVPHKQNSPKVVNPPKDSCFDLPIVFPSIPPGGTKSRVETQIRITLDLASPNSDSSNYDRVGSWKWLRLSPGTCTKRHTRKQGNIDANPRDTLNLITDIVCASAPTVPIVSCSSCRTREAKRVAKKIAARVRPVRSDSESVGDDPFAKKHEDTNSILQFNCAQVLDFSAGSAVLPLRITCYCRHHREKVGFLVRFTMLDNVGRVVGAGISRPIMITDDHKTSPASNRHAEFLNAFSPAAPDRPHQSLVKEASPTTELRGPARRKKVMAKRRPKPYDSLTKHGRCSREGSVSSFPSPSTVYSPLPTTRSPTPSVLQNLLTTSEVAPQIQSQAHMPIVPALQPLIQSSGTPSPDILSTPLDHNSDIHMPEIVPSTEKPLTGISLREIHQPSPSESNLGSPQIPFSAPRPLPMMLSQAAALSTPLLFLFFDPTQASQNLAAVQMPIIHRLIPNMGPTSGGVEVTVLGANFYSNLNLRCIFGEVVASSTQRWSDNTLVCLLPPRARPGIVAVWFEGVLQQPNVTPSLFTYSDESDRALMELALQVVGLKMTGKIEDAKNVAMRIVGGGGGGGPDNQNSFGHDTPNMQLSNHLLVPFNRDFRPLLFGRAGETENFEKAVIDFLSILDTPLDSFSFPHSITTYEAISQTTPTGQSLLHLATYMRLPALVEWLIKHEVDMDARDKNGYTALHFAALVACTECARIMVSRGADREIVNCLGKTAEEIAPDGFFDAVLPISIGGGNLFCGDDGDDGDVESEIDIMEEEEGEAGWRDVEGEEEEYGEREVSRDEIIKTRKWLKRRTPRRTARKKKNIKKMVVNVAVGGRGTPRRSTDISPQAVTPSSVSSFPSKLSTDIKSKNDSPSSTTVPLERPNPDGMRAAAAASPSDADDAKQTASFIDLIHRTLTQLSELPKKTPLALPFPNLPLPDLKKGNIGMPGWNALSQLPQIPMVFSVFVIPTPAWPWFLAGFGSDVNDNNNDNDDNGNGSEDRREKAGDTRTQGVEEEKTMGDVGETNKPNAREWGAMWERWFALVMAKQQEQQVDRDIPPPEYTPRAAGHTESAAHDTCEEGVDICTYHEVIQKDTDTVHVSIPTGGEEQQVAVQSWSSLEVSSSIQDNNNATTTTGGSCLPRLQQHTHSHSIGYNNDIHIPLPREELDAYTYQPPVKQKQKRRKDDRMLLRFWLPVLLLSMIWAFYIGLRFAYTNLRSTLPLTG